MSLWTVLCCAFGLLLIVVGGGFLAFNAIISVPVHVLLALARWICYIGMLIILVCLFFYMVDGH